MSKDTYTIGLAGGSGSGKTSFIRDLKKYFNSQEVCFISLDDYYLARELQLTDTEGIKNFDLPESIKSEELAHDIQKLRSGESIRKKKYTFNNDEAEEAFIELNPAPIIIVEGLYIYHYSNLKDVFDLKLFIDARDELKLIRRIKRDQKERNYPVEDVIYRYEHHVMPSYRKHIEIYKESADIVINNNKNYKVGLEVIKSFVSEKLKE